MLLMQIQVENSYLVNSDDIETTAFSLVYIMIR